MNYSVMDQYWIWLSSVEGIGAKRFYMLLSVYEDARAVWDALGGDACPEEMKPLGRAAYVALKKCRSERYFYALFDALDKKGIRAVSRLSDDYPSQLTGIVDPPPTLYVRGECPLDLPRMFAVIGSRRCTMDGQRAAKEFSEALAREEVAVVSGLARGIDSYAHRGALNGKGRTVAVLGCGPDVVYPPENEGLVQEILDNGGAVVSEFTPGTKPLPGNFPQRNRIISGLCSGLLLVEGAEKSGAMITVNFALEQGRDVFAVPGSIYSPLSTTPNRMIRDGAVPAISPWDILEFYRWASRPEKPDEDKISRAGLSPEELALVEQLREQALTFDELAILSGFSASKLNSHLTMLELRGIIVKVPGGMYRAYL